MPSDAPLVSAIMPTCGRVIMAHQALQMFLDQSYPHKELVIVDELHDRSFAGRPDFSDVRYHLLETRLTIGEKRNLAVKNANGTIIIHWDSDDLYSPDRIEHQVDMLLSGDYDMSGYNRMTFLDDESGKRVEYRGGQGYIIGVSMCYHRRVWEDRPFPSKDVGEDNGFQFGRNLRKITSDAGDRIIARIHEGNTSEKREVMRKNPAQWVVA